jgi:hypothetical protein
LTAVERPREIKYRLADDIAPERALIKPERSIVRVNRQTQRETQDHHDRLSILDQQPAESREIALESPRKELRRDRQPAHPSPS